MKTEQLQIRLTPAQKSAIRLAAQNAGKEVSAWVLEKLIPNESERFIEIACELQREHNEGRPLSYVFASLNDFLTSLSSNAFLNSTNNLPALNLPLYELNYLAAMIESAAFQKKVAAPNWTLGIQRLERPHFATDMLSLRLHLLVSSPPAFRARNIFIDSTIGDRV